MITMSAIVTALLWTGAFGALPVAAFYEGR